MLDEQRQKAIIRDKGTNMISQPENRISLFYTFVRIMYIMLNDVYGQINHAGTLIHTTAPIKINGLHICFICNR